MKEQDYKVLHIGEEASHPLDKKIVHKAKKAHLMNMFSFMAIGAMFLGLFIVSSSSRTQADESQKHIEALMDEVGSLSQENFSLSQQVESQLAVLQSIESDFSEIEEVVELFDKDFAGFKTSIDDDFKIETQNIELSSVEDDENIDFLLLGTNGAHTDTIMVASVNIDKQKVSLFSIPRDLYVNGRRINAYYNTYGVEQLERMVEAVTDLEIDYYAEIDLDGFEEVINLIGGVDVYVEEAIYDGLYPNSSGGYSAYSISAGQYHFDGEDALKYARSRKSTSDFHRAARQQEIINALRTKVIQMDSVMSTKELAQLFQAFLAYIETDMALVDMVGAYYDYKDYEVERGFVLSSSNYLSSTINQSGAYILLPNSGNWQEIQEAIQELVN